MIKLPKRTINVTLILATLVAAVYYFNKHRSLLTELRHISLATGLIVFGLYIVMFLVLMFIFTATMNVTRLKLTLKENGLLNAYSLFMNFFIPGQTGPAFRAYYLRKHHNLKILDYTLATIFYYLFYGVVSLVLVFAGSAPFWLTILACLAMVIVGTVGLKLYLHRFKHERLNISVSTLSYLLGATALQALLQAVIYFVELHSLNTHIRIDQVITYTGAANLALFVALTPGAIGIRESFLILTEKLHHISSSTIVVANVIDRSVFIIFLLVVGIVIVLVKAKDKLGVAKFKADESKVENLVNNH
jgi:uncharacterized membrane protein YbhN (UPF0104 family)